MRKLLLVMVVAAWLPVVRVRAAEDGPPLAGLPSKPGEHVAKIKAMRRRRVAGPGHASRRPQVGHGPGRSWGARWRTRRTCGPRSSSARAGHGWWDKETGRYMDDLWAYDVNAHRWVCVYPGADVNTLDLKLNDHGVEVTKDGQPRPVAQMVHGYKGTTYDPDRHRFLFMPCSGGYWEDGHGAARGWRGSRTSTTRSRRTAAPGCTTCGPTVGPPAHRRPAPARRVRGRADLRPHRQARLPPHRRGGRRVVVRPGEERVGRR